MKNQIKKEIVESAKIISNSVSLASDIEKAVLVIVKCIKKGNKVVLFGNGGSAADAQHIAAELVGKYKKNRASYPAISLTSNSSIITSIANDFSFKDIFKRQCESLVKSGDVVIGISTSGNSENILEGLKTSKKRRATTIALVGNKGGKTKKIVDISIIVNSSSTPHIQEVHSVAHSCFWR